MTSNVSLVETRVEGERGRVDKDVGDLETPWFLLLKELVAKRLKKIIFNVQFKHTYLE